MTQESSQEKWYCKTEMPSIVTWRWRKIVYHNLVNYLLRLEIGSQLMIINWYPEHITDVNKIDSIFSNRYY